MSGAGTFGLSTTEASFYSLVNSRGRLLPPSSQNAHLNHNPRKNRAFILLALHHRASTQTQRKRGNGLSSSLYWAAPSLEVRDGETTAVLQRCSRPACFNSSSSSSSAGFSPPSTSTLELRQITELLGRAQKYRRRSASRIKKRFLKDCRKQRGSSRPSFCCVKKGSDELSH